MSATIVRMNGHGDGCPGYWRYRKGRCLAAAATGTHRCERPAGHLGPHVCECGDRRALARARVG